MNSKDEIKSYGLFATLVCTMIGIGIFSYPRELAELVNNDGWIVTIISGLIYMIIVSLIYKVCYLNEFKPFDELVKENVGNFIGNLILTFYAIYILMSASVQVRSFVEVVKKYLLEKTPTEFLIIATILVAAYIIRVGLSNLVRFNEVSFFIMFIPVVFILIVLLKGSDFTNLLPVFQNKPIEYIKALSQSLLSFAGIEILFLLLPFVKNKCTANKASIKAIGFTTVFYGIINIFCIAILSREETKKLLWPTISMITSIDIPGLFVERWEGVVMALWILFFFTTFINSYYFSCDIIKNTFKLQDIRLSILISMPLIYIMALFPKNLYVVRFFTKYILRPLIVLTAIVLPLLFYFIGKVKLRRRDRKK
ncbi:spore germination protein [Clostridium sp. MSJ-4]|uniref:Spore germination protein n=1 Tax=Clostridium simiarum TaxID=2841506 RepID=A0ABS6EVZ9_9CLOT|nr:endospore germination permease [Clostridium simiarum]MBU5590290.1 spore germination protein [Clostridium simiarum]